MPHVQFRVVAQRQVPAQRVQKKIVIPHVQRLARWSMVLLCASQAYVMEETAEIPQLQIEQQHGEARTPTAQHPESEKPSRG